MRRRSVKKLALEALDTAKNCGVHDMAFAPIPSKYKKRLSEYQKERFDLWWESWIKPLLQEIIDK